MIGRGAKLRTALLTVLFALLALGAVAGPAAAGGFGVTKPPKKAIPNQDTLRIGWFYTDEEYTGEHMNRLKLSWPSCTKAGGQYVDFPANVHIYPFREPPGPKNHARFLAFNGNFFSQLYIGASAKPGKVKLKLKCVGPHNHTLGSGNLTVSFVRQPMTFHEGDIPQTLITPDLFAGETSNATYTGITIPSCSEPSIRSISVSSPAIAGGGTATLGRYAAPGVEDGGFFQAALTGSPSVPPGEYPISISCGSGPIGTGMIRLQPASAPF